MRGHVYNDMHLFQWMHSEPQGTTLAVNYIMSFNSSTPKIDGYYISSILATEKKAADEGSLLACKSTLITYRSAELSSQPNSRKYCTYILFTALSQREEGEQKIQTSTPIPWQTALTLYLQVDYIYTIHTWHTSAADSNARNSFCAFPSYCTDLQL